LTVGEIAALMGWPKGHIPVGPDPVAQIGKGVVPATGRWLAEQIRLCLSGDWATEDFESSYNHVDDTWYGGNTTGKLEKTFNLTYYIPPLLEDVEETNDVDE